MLRFGKRCGVHHAFHAGPYSKSLKEGAHAVTCMQCKRCSGALCSVGFCWHVACRGTPCVADKAAAQALLLLIGEWWQTWQASCSGSACASGLGLGLDLG